MMGSGRKLLAVMFTDIAGYTSMSAQNEAETLELVESVNKILKVYVKTLHGKWIKQVGDGTLSTFDSAVDALVCAISIQKAFLNDDRVTLRVGIHIGDVVLKDSDVWGDGVNIASRIESFAGSGQIAVSQSVKESVSSHPEFEFTSLGEQSFKGVSKPIHVYGISASKITLKSNSAHQPITQSKKKLKAIRGLLFTTVFVSVLLLIYFFLSNRQPTFHIQYSGENTKLKQQVEWIEKDFIYQLSPFITFEKASSNADVLISINESDGRLSLRLNIQDNIFTSSYESADYLYADAAKILKKIVENLSFLGKKQKQIVSLYLETINNLERDTTVQAIEHVKTQVESILRLSANQPELMALKCRLSIKELTINYAPAEEVIKKASDDCLVLIEMLGNIKQADVINLTVADYYAVSKQYEFALSFHRNVKHKGFSWYFTLSEIYFENHQYEKARDLLLLSKEEVGIYNWSADFKLAHVYYELGEIVKSIELYRNILDFDSDIFDVKTNLASCLFELGEMVEADNIFNEINSLNPTASSLMNHGTVLYYLNRYVESAGKFEQALTFSPNDYLIAGNYADSLHEVVGRKADSELYYRQAIDLAVKEIRLDDYDEYILLDLAHYHSQLKDFSQADFYFEKFLSEQPSNKDYFYYLAISMIRRGDEVKAKQYLQKAVELGYPLDYIESTPALQKL